MIQKLLPILLFSIVITHVKSLDNPYARAVPSLSKRYIIETLKQFNPYLNWDESYLLEGISADYLNCKIPQGVLDINVPRSKDLLMGFVDYGKDSGYHVDSVNDAFRKVVEKWLQFGQFNEMFRVSSKFGCSVNPGCNEQDDRLAIACIFTGGQTSFQTYHPIYPTYSTTPDDDYIPANDEPALTEATASSKARVFSEQNYSTVEFLFKRNFNHSAYLTSLSLVENDCSKIQSSDKIKTESVPVEENRKKFIGSVKLENERTGEDEEGVKNAIEKMLILFEEIPADTTTIGCSYNSYCYFEKERFLLLACFIE